jgi:glycosyltransferase involved in cell wall biosynthesis
MLTALTRHYGPLANTQVIHNGRQLPGLRWQTKDEIILAAGRLWDEAKNIAVLEKVAGALPWPICVAGEELHPNGSKPAWNTLQCLGLLAIDELIPWYSRAAIYVLPARYEPFGLSALEAGLADCALVLGDIPSLREIWGKAAVFVPPDDPEALRYSLIDLMMNWRRLISMGVRARNRAQELTPLRMAASYLAAYGRVLDEVPAEQKGEAALPQAGEEVVVCAS